jgi:hypothetical protein
MIGGSLMCTYYFHVRDEIGLVQDQDGIDLPDLRTAAAEAMRSAREYVADGCSALTNASFEIADDSGRIVLSVPIQEIHAGQ